MSCNCATGRCPHASDCAVHNAPALEPGPCSCGAEMSPITGLDATEAVAEAWASIDGKLEAFRACKTDAAREQTEGRYVGYTADAEELISRTARRGWVLVRRPAP